jgi:hypothetical protein
MALKIPIVQLNSFSWVSSAHLSVLDSFSHDLEIGWCGGVRCQGDAENTKTSFNADAGLAMLICGKQRGALPS